jgi:MFS transporter, PPP family, 3-phenylpropionic acid transporter
VKPVKDIDVRNLWLIRLYYIFYFGGMGAIFPFLTLFYVHNGLSGTEIGVLNALVALGSFISAPIWGWLSDNAFRPRLILQIALVLDCLTLYLVSRQTAFLFITIFIVLNALAAGGVNPQSQIQALLISEKNRTGYGSIRLCGSLGYALAALISGTAIQQTPLLAGFYLFCALTLLAALILFMIRNPSTDLPEQEPQARPQKTSISGIFSVIFKNRQLVAYLFALIIVAIMSNGISFESVYLQRLGANGAVIGRLSTLGALVEIPMMLLADRLMRKKGSTITLIMGWLFYVVALLAIVIHPSIASFILYRVILGLSFSLYAVSCTYFVVERTPDQQAGTILAFFSVTVGNLINMVASPISGALFDWAGPYWLYVIALAGYCIAAAIIFFSVFRKKAR